MPLLQLDQRSPEWLAARRGKVTASLAAACLGLDPHVSPARAWRQILGEPNPANKHMNWGIAFEDAARADYESETGNLVQTTGLWVHPDHDWLGASPDGLIGNDGLVEIKCPSRLPERIPVHHRIQVLVQLLVTGRQWCDYFVWTHSGVYLERVTRPHPLRGLLRALERFYQTYVVTEIQPPRRKR